MEERIFFSLSKQKTSIDDRADKDYVDPYSEQGARGGSKNDAVKIDGNKIIVHLPLLIPCCQNLKGCYVLGAPGTDSSVISSGDFDDCQYLVNLHNYARSKSLQALEVDTRLEDSARIHSDDMIENGFFSHDGSKGDTPESRIENAGISGYVSENIAQIPFVNPTKTQLKKLFEGWMTSDGHRRNILDPSFNRIGIYSSFDEIKGIRVYTVNFAYLETPAKYSLTDDKINDPENYTAVEDYNNFLKTQAGETFERTVVLLMGDGTVERDSVEVYLFYGCQKIKAVEKKNFVNGAWKTVVEAEYQEKPSFILQYSFPVCGCINSYEIEVDEAPANIPVYYKTNFVGGNIVTDYKKWQHGQKYRKLWNEQPEYLPYFGQTNFKISGGMNNCPVYSGDNYLMSNQFRIIQITNIQKWSYGFDFYEIISGEDLDGSITALNNDHYPYEVGDYVLAFLPETQLELPFERKVGGEEIKEFIKIEGDLPPNITLALSQEKSLNIIGSDHTVTAKLTDPKGNISGEKILFKITDGPNAGFEAESYTDANGETSFEYTGNILGIDTIIGTFSFFDGEDEEIIQSNTLLKEWVSELDAIQYRILPIKFGKWGVFDG